MAEAVVITDKQGRKLRLRELTVLDQARLLRAIGPDQSMNQPYVNIVQAAAAVTHVDETPMPSMANERGIDSAIGLLGDDALWAVYLYQQKKMQEQIDSAVAAQSGEGKTPDPLDLSVPS